MLVTRIAKNCDHRITRPHIHNRHGTGPNCRISTDVWRGNHVIAAGAANVSQESNCHVVKTQGPEAAADTVSASNNSGFAHHSNSTGVELGDAAIATAGDNQDIAIC